MRLRLPLLIAALYAAACGCGGATEPARGGVASAAPEIPVSTDAAEPGAPRPTNGDAARAGTMLPDATLQDLDGKATPLVAYLQGRVALVSFWATWCDACYAEMDSLNRLSAQASTRRDTIVVGVAVGEDRAKVAAFARARGLSYPLLVDPDFALTDALGERRVPATLVVAHDGRITFRGGALDSAALAAFRTAVGEAD